MSPHTRRSRNPRRHPPLARPLHALPPLTIPTPRSPSDEREHAILRHFLHPVVTSAGIEARMHPPTSFKSFAVEDRPGEQWVRLRAAHRGIEEIKIDATMFDPSSTGSRRSSKDRAYTSASSSPPRGRRMRDDDGGRRTSGWRGGRGWRENLAASTPASPPLRASSLPAAATLPILLLVADELAPPLRSVSLCSSSALNRRPSAWDTPPPSLAPPPPHSPHPTIERERGGAHFHLLPPILLPVVELMPLLNSTSPSSPHSTGGARRPLGQRPWLQV